VPYHNWRKGSHQSDPVQALLTPCALETGSLFRVGVPRMQSPKSPRRITKTAVRQARSAKRRTVKARVSRPAAQPSTDALLIAQFAEALGQSPRKMPRTKRRSLAEALQQTSRSDDVLAIMPGARVAQPAVSVATSVSALAAAPPCLAAVRRRRLNGKVSGAASWCVAFLVTAGIVSAAAYGFVSQAPFRSIEAITTASAAQF
jgi:hypothetical protein